MLLIHSYICYRKNLLYLLDYATYKKLSIFSAAMWLMKNIAYVEGYFFLFCVFFFIKLIFNLIEENLVHTLTKSKVTSKTITMPLKNCLLIIKNLETAKKWNKSNTEWGY